MNTKAHAYHAAVAVLAANIKRFPDIHPARLKVLQDRVTKLKAEADERS